MSGFYALKHNLPVPDISFGAANHADNSSVRLAYWIPLRTTLAWSLEYSGLPPTLRLYYELAHSGAIRRFNQTLHPKPLQFTLSLMKNLI